MFSFFCKLIVKCISLLGLKKKKGFDKCLWYYCYFSKFSVEGKSIGIKYVFFKFIIVGVFVFWEVF